MESDGERRGTEKAISNHHRLKVSTVLPKVLLLAHMLPSNTERLYFLHERSSRYAWC